MEYEVVNGQIRAYETPSPEDLVNKIKDIDQQISQLEAGRDEMLNRVNSQILELQTTRDKISSVIDQAVNGGVMATPDVSLSPVLKVDTPII